MHSRWRRFPWKGWFPVSRNFYWLTCVKFTFANEIEAKHLRSLVSVKVEPRTWLKFTWVNLRSQKRVSGNQPEDRSYAGHNLMDVYKMVDLSGFHQVPRAFFFSLSPAMTERDLCGGEKASNCRVVILLLFQILCISDRYRALLQVLSSTDAAHTTSNSNCMGWTEEEARSTQTYSCSGSLPSTG